MSAIAHPRRGVPFATAVSFLCWAGTFFGARVALENLDITGIGRTLVALVPLPFFVVMLVAFLRMVRGMDELERRIQLEALAFAFPLSLVLVMTLGLLEVAHPLNPRDWTYRHLWPFLVLFYTIGIAMARRRYQ